MTNLIPQQRFPADRPVAGGLLPSLSVQTAARQTGLTVEAVIAIALSFGAPAPSEASAKARGQIERA